jgi:hypothetical protein
MSATRLYSVLLFSEHYYINIRTVYINTLSFSTVNISPPHVCTVFLCIEKTSFLLSEFRQKNAGGNHAGSSIVVPFVRPFVPFVVSVCSNGSNGSNNSI